MLLLVLCGVGGGSCRVWCSSAGGAQGAAEAQSDAAVQEALRGVLRDMEARQEDIKAAIAELSNTAVDDTQRVPLLQEALTLKTALAVAHRRGAAYV